MMNNVWYVVSIFAAFGGFLLAFYIRHKKLSAEKMACPFYSDCDAVIYSRHSKFFGVPVEVLGLLYYGLTAASYALFLAFPPLASNSAAFGVFILTVTAFLFSLYLTFIQAFALRQWCVWCLVSAGLCAAIFAAAFRISEFDFASLFVQYRDLTAVLHFLGVALGVGGATVAAIFSFKFLKDFRVSEWEADAMHTLSQIVWFSLALLTLTGAGLYLAAAETLSRSAQFLIESVIIAAIIANGAFLDILILPKLVSLSFGEKRERQPEKLRRQRKIAFALGAVSIVSWYSMFVLRMIQRIPSDFSLSLLIYFLFLAGAVAASQLMERFSAKQTSSVQN